MKLHNLLKNNAKLYIVMGIIILLGIVGTSFALVIGRFNAIAVNTTADVIDASIDYAGGADGTIITGNSMLPIKDEYVTLTNDDPRIFKVSFSVTGNSNNPSNTIYDIALHDIMIDCELRMTDLKWRLYKGDELISKQNASLSPKFDTMAGNRLVLTETQQDLTDNAQEYTFLLWISESCTGDITECDSSMDQSKYLNKTISASIKLELSTKTKKNINRITGSEESCSYIETEVPVCNTLTYNGSSQTLVSDGDYYTATNNSGINAGKYVVTLSLDDDYKWSDGSTDDRAISCNIDKKNVTVTTLNQESDYLGSITSEVSDISTSGLLNGDSVEWVTLSTNEILIGKTSININNIKIVDSDGNDVTYNYNVIKNNTGTVTYSGRTATFYYYSNGNVVSTTATCGIYDGSSTCKFDIPEEVIFSSGPLYSSYYGVSTSPSSSTITTTYNSNNLNYYAVYRGSWTATYTKDSTVSSIGSTGNSCTNYKITNGSTYTSTSCTVTLPSINLSSYHDEPGWYNSSGTKVGNAGASLTLSANGTYTAKARYLESSYFSYDNSKTGVDCSDVSCMLDKLYDFVK